MKSSDMINRLLFGTAGVPIGCKERSSEEGIRYVRELGLDCMELEFVRGVRMSEESAKKLKPVAEENEIVLTAHAPYYINLNSPDIEKIPASIKRIYETAKIADFAGGYSITFHAAYYMKSTKEQTYAAVKKAIKELIGQLKQDNNKIWIRPETTGKETQWGNMQEIIALSQEFDQILPCVDFAHLFSRSVGKINTKEDFITVMKDIETALGREAIKNMHIHMSGMNYGPKGEKNHLVMKESEFNYKGVLDILKDFNAKGVVICESPNIEEDAMLMKKYYEK